MVRKIVYWVCTGLVSLSLFGALTYLTGSPEVVNGFAKQGYPQHLRIVLGIVKPLAAVVLLLPRFALLKEWAYAGVTYALTMAFIAARAAGESPQTWMLPPILLVLLAASYFTRPVGRRLAASGK